MRFAYRALTFCGVPFQNTFAEQQICNSLRHLVPPRSGPTTPSRQRHQAIAPTRFGLFPFRSPLLRESHCFLFLGVFRCFSSPGSLYPPYVFRRE